MAQAAMTPRGGTSQDGGEVLKEIMREDWYLYSTFTTKMSSEDSYTNGNGIPFSLATPCPTKIISFSHPADLSAVGNQNKMKLRVNRVAILQELKPEHVVGYLARTGVLTAAEMRAVCTDRKNPVGVLLDILALKENRTHWYFHFITSLKEAEVSVDQKRRYCRLVDFLENTIIRFPKREDGPKPDKQFPRYQPLPSITPKQESTTTCNQRTTSDSTTSQATIPQSTATPEQRSVTPVRGNATSQEAKVEVTIETIPMTLISGHYHQWVPSPRADLSRLPDPKDILIDLDTADDQAFHLQIKAEKLVLHRMKQLETLYIMHRQRRIPTGFILCMADCITEIVNDRDNHHLYVKYFQILKNDYNFYIVKEIVGSFSNWLMATKLGDVEKNQDLLNRVTKFGMNLFDLLDELGDYRCAESVISVLTVWLMVQPCLETWMHGYNACVKLCRIRIRNFEFKDADNALSSATQYLNAIKLMSFGKDLVDESEKMVATSWLMHELGNHHNAFYWAVDGIKEVRPENKQGIINAICNGVRCYASKYNIRRAHEMAVEAVRLASEYFGRIHPVFINARLAYIDFVTEFSMPNVKILRLAQETLKRCQLMYHCEDSMLLARSHMALSKAYVACQKFNDDGYINHARKAQRIAMNCVSGTHPILAVFAEHLAHCSLIKSRIVPKPPPPADAQNAMKISQLIYAASELSVSYRIYCVCFGVHSYRAATAQITLAEILEEEGNFEDAEVMFEGALKTFEKSMNKTSPYLRRLKARVAKFYYKKGELQKSLDMMDAVITSMTKDDKLETGPIRVEWMEEALTYYLKAIADTNDDERLQTARELQDDWLTRTDYLQPVTMTELDQQPQLFTEFRKSFMLWSRVEAKKVARLATELTTDNEETEEDTQAINEASDTASADHEPLQS